jgi:hypothetical protein
MTPAEIVNYTPSLFLVPTYNTLNPTNPSNIRWSTISETELPARF